MATEISGNKSIIKSQLNIEVFCSLCQWLRDIILIKSFSYRFFYSSLQTAIHFNCFQTDDAIDKLLADKVFSFKTSVFDSNLMGNWIDWISRGIVISAAYLTMAVINDGCEVLYMFLTVNKWYLILVFLMPRLP